jgi:putative ABC transport system ATP-binding protein
MTARNDSAYRQDTILSIKGLDKSYAEQPVIASLSMELSAQEIVAITGPSGCGKTTLLNLIAGLDQPDRGSITIDGQTLFNLNEQQRTLLRRRSIGFIFQFFNLIPTLTVLENCLLPIELNNPANKISQSDLVKTQLCETGMKGKLEHYPEQLSGGEQQRVAIIRALAHQPKLILADEPTGNLDQETAETMADYLCHQTRLNHCALLIVTHSQDLAKRANRVLHMQNKTLK